MSETMKILWSYIRKLIKKWIIWLSLAFFITGIIFEFVLDIEEIPSYIFWILAFLVFLWANFQVYKKLYINYDVLEKSHRELEKSHKELKKNHETLEKKIPKKDRELIIKPELSIMLLEGNEYTFYLLEKATYIRRKIGNDYAVPDSLIELHFRILNTGTIDLDIISIESSYEYISLPWTFSPISIAKEKGDDLLFPRHLDVKEFLLCDLDSTITPQAGLNDAQFAARLVEINKKSKCIEFTVCVEARDSKGKIYKFSLEFEAALRPLVDLYINKWQEKNQNDLLRLSRSEEE